MTQFLVISQVEAEEQYPEPSRRGATSLKMAIAAYRLLTDLVETYPYEVYARRNTGDPWDHIGTRECFESSTVTVGAADRYAVPTGTI